MAKENGTDKYYSFKEVGETLGIRESELRKWVKGGILKKKKIGDNHYLTEESIKACFGIKAMITNDEFKEACRVFRKAFETEEPHPPDLLREMKAATKTMTKFTTLMNKMVTFKKKLLKLEILKHQIDGKKKGGIENGKTK